MLRCRENLQSILFQAEGIVEGGNSNTYILAICPIIWQAAIHVLLHGLSHWSFLYSQSKLIINLLYESATILCYDVLYEACSFLKITGNKLAVTQTLCCMWRYFKWENIFQPFPWQSQARMLKQFFKLVSCFMETGLVLLIQFVKMSRK
jgi:hypothetical protein